MGSLIHNISFLILLFLSFLAVSFVCDCSPPKPSPNLHNPPKHPLKPHQSLAVTPPKPSTKPPTVKPPPSSPKPPMNPPTIKPPTHKPPPVVTSQTPCPPPTLCPPPSLCPSPTPCPLPTPTPPVAPPKPTPPEPETCPIDTVKLGACVDVLGGCIHMGIGKSYAKQTCCPVLGGLFSMDAAICLCTTIEAKFFNMDLIIPIAVEILLDCGKPPPPGFKCKFD
ncbi:Hydrophobic seed protein domain-containing protein [Hirschfeldia incana]|nr:Hydrophobic seed protein domain-containing protein [Hirschfeldia incana]